ncbi:MAG TPA: hypothetical protein VHK47_07290 [Polyangia bacterium]|nr:hypothetical protein [Polyangia bacterium]
MLAASVLVGLAIAGLLALFSAGQGRLRQAANPCEHDCLQDSGGLASCRQECASHPLTYGPAVQRPSH